MTDLLWMVPCAILLGLVLVLALVVVVAGAFFCVTVLAALVVSVAMVPVVIARYLWWAACWIPNRKTYSLSEYLDFRLTFASGQGYH